MRAQDAAFRAHLEATAAEIEADEKVLHENRRPQAIVFVTAGILFGVAALALALFGLPGLSPQEARIVAAVALVCGVALGGPGLYRLRDGERVIMALRPEGLHVPGLDRAIAWDDIADLDMTLDRLTMVTRLLLPPEVAVPQRIPGGRGIKVDPKRRIVTLKHGLPRKMKPQDFADLIGRYRDAAQARRILAEIAARPVPHESQVA